MLLIEVLRIGTSLTRRGNHTEVRGKQAPPMAQYQPLNEFTTKDYMSCAFPTLFPSGRADFVYCDHRKLLYPPHAMVSLHSIPVSDISPSILKCDGMLYRWATSMLNSTHEMLASLWMNSVTYVVGHDRNV